MQLRLGPQSWTRRDFLVAASTGTAVIVMPRFLSGCAIREAMPRAGVLPAGEGVGHFAAFGISEEMLRRVLGEAMSKGATFADLFFQHRINNHLQLEDGAVNRADTAVDLGCGVRVVKGDQTGFAFSEDLTGPALLTAAKTAAAIAAGPAAATLSELERRIPPTYYTATVAWEDVGIEKKIPLLERAQARATAMDPRITKVRGYLGDVTSYTLVATSEGLVVEDVQPMAEASVSCVAEQNGRREENHDSFGVRHGFEAFTLERMDQLAENAVRRTLVLFEATPPPAGEYPVVLAPGLSGILLHEAIGHGMEADFNRKGLSVYADRIGQAIAPRFVTIVDDGTNGAERGTINVDDEGTASQRTVLVEDGILRSYMHDRISAAHYRLGSTGNGRRESYRFPPVPRMRNTYMMNGTHHPEEIIGSVKKGLYAELFLNGQVNIGAGDFSFYLKNGYLIEDGQRTRPVKDANLIGFGPRVLEQVEMVGDDLRLFSGLGFCGKDGQRVPVGFGLPTVKCGGISVGGVG